MFERALRNVLPARAITAPEPWHPDWRDEAVRLATFDQSRRTVGGQVAEFRPPPRPRIATAPIEELNPDLRMT